MSTQGPPIPVDPWTDENYLNAAKLTGKPLEVRCAIAFLNAGWQVFPGIYLNDLVTGVPRELDVLAEKYDHIELPRPDSVKPRILRTVIQVCVSCKGFNHEVERPVTYSLSHKSGLLPAPAHVLHHVMGDRFAVGEKVGTKIVGELLKSSSRVFGFDVFQKDKDKLKAKGDRQAKGGEESIYPGMDSAIKAAMYWNKSQESDRELASLQLPVLVLRHPWKNFILDGGEAKTADTCDRAYMVAIHPRQSGISQSHRILSLIWAESALPDLVGYLGKLSDWFRENVRLSLVGV